MTNKAMRQRLYNARDKRIYGLLRTPTGTVTVAIPVQTAIDILHELGAGAVCPCRLRIKQNVGFLLPPGESPPAPEN